MNNLTIQQKFLVYKCEVLLYSRWQGKRGSEESRTCVGDTCMEYIGKESGYEWKTEYTTARSVPAGV